jgi:hypothetical protein
MAYFAGSAAECPHKTTHARTAILTRAAILALIALLLKIIDPRKKPIRSGDMIPISDANLEAELSFFAMYRCWAGPCPE